MQNAQSFIISFTFSLISTLNFVHYGLYYKNIKWGFWFSNINIHEVPIKSHKTRLILMFFICRIFRSKKVKEIDRNENILNPLVATTIHNMSHQEMVVFLLYRFNAFDLYPSFSHKKYKLRCVRARLAIKFS